MAAKEPDRHQTKQSNFRFDADTLATLKRVTDHMTATVGVPFSNADTVRKLINDAAKKLPK